MTLLNSKSDTVNDTETFLKQIMAFIVTVAIV